MLRRSHHHHSTSKMIQSVQRVMIIRRLLVSIMLFGFMHTSLAHAQQAIPSSAAAPFASPLSTTTEDWNHLAIRPQAFEHTAPIVGQADTFPEFTRELIRVEWRPGDPIDLYIVRPVGVTNPPVIVYLYGYPREAVRFLDPAFCKTITQHGFAAVGFSSMLTGQRYHDVPMKMWFVSELDRSLTGTAHDVQMVLNYLDERRDFNMERVGVFGEGSGATIALLAATADSRIKAVDMLNPWGEWNSWMAGSPVVPERERADLTTPQFLNRIAPLDPVQVLPRIQHPPLRLQQTLWSTPDVTPASSERIAAALPPSATLVQYKDEQDYTDRAGQNGKMLDWLEQQLTPRSAESTPSIH